MAFVLPAAHLPTCLPGEHKVGVAWLSWSMWCMMLRVVCCISVSCWHLISLTAKMFYVLGKHLPRLVRAQVNFMRRTTFLQLVLCIRLFFHFLLPTWAKVKAYEKKQQEIQRQQQSSTHRCKFYVRISHLQHHVAYKHTHSHTQPHIWSVACKNLLL